MEDMLMTRYSVWDYMGDGYYVQGGDGVILSCGGIRPAMKQFQ